MTVTDSIKFVCVECGNEDDFIMYPGNEWDDYDGLKVECEECNTGQSFIDQRNLIE